MEGDCLPGLSDHNTVTFQFDFPRDAEESGRKKLRWRLHASEEEWEQFRLFAGD